ncbi:MAG TPA: hypothetical protein VJU84_11105 [Pyrinomonadaceae bacterium]|nr:hypothetical protein [Pyrinomonadaceae bacterium]
MKAVEQHGPGKSGASPANSADIASVVLRERLLELNIPWKRLALYVGLSLGFFLLGFVPMWLKAGNAMEQRDAAQREVRLGQLQSTLTSALIKVERDEYEPARQLTSEFYTNLRGQIDSNDASIFTPAQRQELRPLLYERDDVITLLARSDPAASDRLFAIYLSYQKVSGNGG